MPLLLQLRNHTCKLFSISTYYFIILITCHPTSSMSQLVADTPLSSWHQVAKLSPTRRHKSIASEVASLYWHQMACAPHPRPQNYRQQLHFSYLHLGIRWYSAHSRSQVHRQQVTPWHQVASRTPPAIGFRIPE